eukprot:3587926-Rhodomonas_salina.3
MDISTRTDVWYFSNEASPKLMEWLGKARIECAPHAPLIGIKVWEDSQYRQLKKEMDAGLHGHPINWTEADEKNPLLDSGHSHYLFFNEASRAGTHQQRRKPPLRGWLSFLRGSVCQVESVHETSQAESDWEEEWKAWRAELSTSAPNMHWIEIHHGKDDGTPKQRRENPVSQRTQPRSTGESTAPNLVVCVQGGVASIEVVAGAVENETAVLLIKALTGTRTPTDLLVHLVESAETVMGEAIVDEELIRDYLQADHDGEKQQQLEPAEQQRVLDLARKIAGKRCCVVFDPSSDKRLASVATKALTSVSYTHLTLPTICSV